MGTNTQRDDGPMVTKADRGCHEPRDAGNHQELGEARKDPPWGLQRERGSAHAWIRASGLQNHEGVQVFPWFEAIRV